MGNERPLSGKVALVTGAGKRLGQRLAVGLGESGADVAVHYFSSEKGATEAAGRIKDYGGRAAAIQADLSTEEGVHKLFDEVDQQFGGRLDILVNSAARYDKFPIEQLSASRWEHTLALNLTAPFLCSREAAVRMRRKSQSHQVDADHIVTGQIVFIADIAAERPWKGFTHYCVSKAGVIMLTKSLALEFAPDIRVNAISPGVVLPEEEATEAHVKELQSRIPLGTLGSPNDVLNALRFLVTDATYMTGQVISVDGGRSVAW